MLRYEDLDKRENTLLHCSPEKLLLLCSTSAEYYFLCADGHFWKKRFRKDKLPLLEEKTWKKLNFPDQETRLEWMKLYDHAVQSREEAAKLVEKRVPFSVQLHDLLSPLPLFLLPMKRKDVLRLWKKKDAKVYLYWLDDTCRIELVSKRKKILILDQPELFLYYYLFYLD